MVGNREYEAVVVAGSGKDWQLGGILHGIAVDEKTHSCFVSARLQHRIRKITFVDD
jgi:hypothetical protein